MGVSKKRMELNRKIQEILRQRDRYYRENVSRTKKDLIEEYVRLGGQMQFTLKTSKSDILFALLDVVHPIMPTFAQLGMLNANSRTKDVEGSIESSSAQKKSEDA